MGLSVIISILVAFLLVYYLGKIKLKVKFFLIFAVLSALYALGKLTHLPSLLIILFFGLIINNRQIFHRFKWIDKHIPDEMSFLELENNWNRLRLRLHSWLELFLYIVWVFYWYTETYSIWGANCWDIDCGDTFDSETCFFIIFKSKGQSFTWTFSYASWLDYHIAFL